MNKYNAIAVLGKISLFANLLDEYKWYYPKSKYYSKEPKPKLPKEKKPRIVKSTVVDRCKACKLEPNSCPACHKDIIYTKKGNVEWCKYYV